MSAPTRVSADGGGGGGGLFNRSVQLSAVCLHPLKHKDALTICWQCDHVQRTMFLRILTGQELKCVNCRPVNLKC